jgi:hypothetical protein
MKYRKLRIAWSVGWGVVGLLLLALWVRSWTMLDNVTGHLPGLVSMSSTSAYGRIVFGMPSVKLPLRLKYQRFVLDENSFGGRPEGPRKWFVFQSDLAGVALQVPHGMLVLLSCIGATVPWLPWRFSLRTLFIAMTLVAVGLGALIYAVR